MSVMDINIATGLRAELEANRNKSLLSGASMALGSFYALQNNISQMIEGLCNFEDINFSNVKTKEKAKDKAKAIVIPITGNANPADNNEEEPDKEDEKENKSKKGKKEKKGKKGRKVNRKKGPSGKPLLRFIRFKTRKAAYEAAKRAGKGGKPIHHAGEKHFHPNDNPNDMKGLDKNILKNGDHYCYP